MCFTVEGDSGTVCVEEGFEGVDGLTASTRPVSTAVPTVVSDDGPDKTDADAVFVAGMRYASLDMSPRRTAVSIVVDWTAGLDSFAAGRACKPETGRAWLSPILPSWPLTDDVVTIECG